MRSIWLEIYICRPLKQKILVGQNRSYEEQVKRREFECGIKAFLLEHCHPWSLSSCNVLKITDVLKSQSAGNCWCSANSVYWGSKLVFVPSRQTRPASKLIFVTNFLIFLTFFSIFYHYYYHVCDNHVQPQNQYLSQTCKSIIDQANIQTSSILYICQKQVNRAYCKNFNFSSFFKFFKLLPWNVATQALEHILIMCLFQSRCFWIDLIQ